MKRCSWVTDDPIYINYHDNEWGIPVHDDNIHFEFLVLESAQAGLSWITILKKRENYRISYDNFDPFKVSLYNEDKINNLLLNPKIIRNRRKIEASINNATQFIKIQKEFGSFDKYIWSFTNYNPIITHYNHSTEVPCFSPLSDKISKDLKKRGFKFIGTKIIYSYLQAVGILNEHTSDCFLFQYKGTGDNSLSL